MKRTDKSYRVTKKGRFRGTFPKPGEITIHTYHDGTPSGAIVLRCPMCNGLQHKHAKIEGPDDAPTIKDSLQCGCKRCLKTFRIRSGSAYLVDDENRPSGPELSNKLVDAGVFYQSEPRGWKKSE